MQKIAIVLESQHPLMCFWPDSRLRMTFLRVQTDRRPWYHCPRTTSRWVSSNLSDNALSSSGPCCPCSCSSVSSPHSSFLSNTPPPPLLIPTTIFGLLLKRFHAFFLGNLCEWQSKWVTLGIKLVFWLVLMCKMWKYPCSCALTYLCRIIQYLFECSVGNLTASLVL